VSIGSRAGFAVLMALLVLAVLRWGPVFAEPPWDVRALPLALPALLLAVAGALTGRERRALPWRVVLAALVVVALLLCAAVLARGPQGFVLEAGGPDGPQVRLSPGAIDVLGRDLRAYDLPRQIRLAGDGHLHAPVSGRYRLWVTGRGHVQVRLRGRTVIDADADPLRAEADVVLQRGPQPLQVLLDWRGAGPRLRLGWSRPDGRSETIPPRYLGETGPRWPWALVDRLALALAALAGALVFVWPWDRPRRAPSPGPVTAGEVGLSAIAYLLLLAAMSWPLLLHPATAGPVDRPDGRLNAWILAWDVDALVHEPARLFQAPIFHPLPDTLAFSENLLLLAVLAAPARFAGGPVFAYNFALVLCLIVSGLGAQLLVRRVSGDRLAAWVAGGCFAAGAYRWTRLAHLHAQATLLLPMALLALDQFWERRTWRRGLLVGLVVALQGLASIYLGAVTAAAVAVAIAVSLFGGLRPADLLRLAAGFLLGGLVLLPALRPYLRMRAFEGQEFTLETVAVYATSLASYAASGTRLWGPVTERQLDPEQVRDVLFPGLTVIVLGLLGLAVAPRRFRAVALAASGVAVVVSLGPETAFYRILHEHVLLLHGVRALGRFAVVPLLALAVLSGLALAGRHWTWSVAALLLVMLESVNAPLRLGTYDGPSPAARSLAGRPGAVAFLPLGLNDTLVMLDGLAHRRPLVNGDSGFLPRPYDRAMELLARPLGEEEAGFLRAIGVTEVVSSGALDWPELASFGSERVHAVPGGEAAHAVGHGDAAPTRWGSEGVVVDLGSPRPVEAVVFGVGDGEWVSRPRVRASLDGRAWDDVAAFASLADAAVSLYQDPRAGLGEIRFPARTVRFVALDPRLPLRRGALEIRPAAAAIDRDALAPETRERGER
jgi:hypothetical protein